jgi:hypothetical protein
MKKIIYSLFILVINISCSKFLEVNPKASIAGESVIVDETSAKAALNGVYSALRDYYSVNYQSIGYLSGDNVEWTGSQSQIQEFINHNVKSENSTISGTWSGIYRTINRANSVIKSLNSISSDIISNNVKNQVLGQALAIRALAYFDLVRVWGGVPIITEPTDKVGQNIGIPRASVQETYKQVLDDLNQAETLLGSTTDRFAITQKTVHALKSRYYLYNKNWALAKEYATKLIGDSNYELANPYYNYFVDNVVGTKESVFELFYSANELNGHRGQWQPQNNGGTRQWAPNTQLIGLLTNPTTGGARSRLIAKDNQNRWYGNLYYRSPATDPTYILRIAELYLIRAEANAHLDQIENSREDLNKIRNRALLEPASFNTKEVALIAIENERRLEFALEGHRWFDLVRTDRAKAVLGFTEDYKLLLPIPYSQILADPVLKQNPGYSL